MTDRFADADLVGERWRDALAELDYAERHGLPAVEIEALAHEVAEARVAMFRSGVQGSWALPAFLQGSVHEPWEPAGWEDGQHEAAADPPDAGDAGSTAGA